MSISTFFFFIIKNAMFIYNILNILFIKCLDVGLCFWLNIGDKSVKIDLVLLQKSDREEVLK